MGATITYKIGHDWDTTYLSHGSTLSSVENFAGLLLPYTNAQITKATITFASHLVNTEKPGEYHTTDLYAHIYMRDIDTDKLYAVVIPAPIESMFEHVSDRGFKVKQIDGETITSYYAQLSGLNLAYHHGWLCGAGP